MDQINVVVLTKNTLVVDSLNAVPDSHWEGTDQNVKVKEERDPCGGLVLGHRGNDRDVNLGIARVPQGVEAPTPWGNEAWR